MSPRLGTRPLRVVYLDHCAQLSGAEIALVRLLSAVNAVVEPYVILGEDGPLVDELRRVGARVAVLPLPESVGTITRSDIGKHLSPWASARAAWYSASLISKLRALDPDLVHTNSLKAAFYGIPAARAARLPVLWHLRDHVSPEYMSAAAVRLVRAATRMLPTAVVANSSATLATVPGARRGRVVPNAVPIPASVPLTAAASSGSLSERPLRIIVLGRLAYWKGQDVFLEAFAMAFPHSGATARIVGSAMFSDEGYEGSLRLQATRLGIADRVEFRGFREDIWPELAASDVLVHCSRTAEPFGQVVIEGLGAGLAVIATDAGGPAEILTDGVDGLLVTPGDAGALSAALVRLADRALRERLSAAGRLTASAYSPKRAAAIMLEVYRSLASPRPHPVSRTSR